MHLQIKVYCDCYTKNNFPKKLKQLVVKPHSLLKIHYVLPIVFVLTLAFDIAVLYESIVFPIVVHSTDEAILQFFKKRFTFLKTYLKI